MLNLTKLKSRAYYAARLRKALGLFYRYRNPHAAQNNTYSVQNKVQKYGYWPPTEKILAIGMLTFFTTRHSFVIVYFWLFYFYFILFYLYLRNVTYLLTRLECFVENCYTVTIFDHLYSPSTRQHKKDSIYNIQEDSYTIRRSFSEFLLIVRMYLSVFGDIANMIAVIKKQRCGLVLH